MRTISLRFEARTSDDGRHCDLGCPGMDCEDGIGGCRRGEILEDVSAKGDLDFLFLRCPSCLSAEQHQGQIDALVAAGEQLARIADTYVGDEDRDPQYPDFGDAETALADWRSAVAELAKESPDA